VKRTKLLPLLLILLFPFFLNCCRSGVDRFASQLQTLVSTASIADEMNRFAEKPHRAGTEQNHAVGDALLDYLRRAGGHVWTTEYISRLPEPVTASLEMTFPVQQQIPFSEKVFEQDPYSELAVREIPYFAYVPDGDVEAEVIYANFGDRQDYAYLKKQGIRVAGKIALVRAQGICRGMKQQIAEEEGLAGLLLYPDIKDQGVLKVAYPDGPGTNSWVTQRGSMLKFFLYPGDPESRNLDRKEATLPTIPALPITSEAAQEIFQKLEGAVNPLWIGGMNSAYRSGSGPARVKISYRSTRAPKKIRNVFASLGGEDPSEPVLIVSCHYDAWVYGAADPSSGTTVVLEAAKALYQLEKKGWKPKRDIVFAFWDAEEFGMIGSTQWVVQHLPEVRSKVAAVVYIDSVRGQLFGASIVPGLRGMLDQVLDRFQDPSTEKSVREFHLEYGMPGFSDDTMAFSNLGGIPVAQLNYGMHYSMYHSIYDNLSWMNRYCDPGYLYTANLARMVALFSIVLTKDSMLPFQFSEFGEHYKKQFLSLKPQKDFAHLAELANDISAAGKEIESIDFSSLTKERKREVNSLLHQAVVSFTDVPGKTDEPFTLRNVTLGPSTQNECAGLEISGIQRAMHLSQVEMLKKETSRAVDAFTRARNLLRKAQSRLKAG
jgi:N-acetylated-alpha-linked acidic dipeptidase